MSDQQYTFYRCTECGKKSFSIGWLHAHCEKHRGPPYLPFNWPWAYGDYHALLEYTETITVTDYEVETHD